MSQHLNLNITEKNTIILNISKDPGSSPKREITLGTAVILLLVVMFGKIFANSMYVGSGASGGMVMPALIVGGLLGAAFGLGICELGLLEDKNIGAFVVVGAVSVLAAMANAPIGCAIFGLELMGVPFAVPSLIGAIISYQISKFETIYDVET